MNNHNNIPPNMRSLVRELSPYYERNGMTKEEAKEEIIRDFINYLHSNDGLKILEILKQKFKKRDLVEKKFIETYIQSIKMIKNMKNTSSNKVKTNETDYTILDLPESASQNDINRAFRKLSLKYHPDRPSGNAEKFKLISAAHNRLSGEEKQAFNYDGGRRKTRRSHKHKGTRKMRRSTHKYF